MRNDAHLRIGMLCFSMTAFESFFMALVGKWRGKKKKSVVPINAVKAQNLTILVTL